MSSNSYILTNDNGKRVSGLPKAKVEDIVYELALPIASKNDCEIVDIEFVKEGPDWFLRVFIDKPNGVDLDDCEAVSRELSEKLDEVDPIEQSYFLEVSSPGIERPLKKDKDFQKYKGHMIEVKLYKPLYGAKVLSGILQDYQDNRIFLRIDDGNVIEIQRKEAAFVKLIADL